MLFRARSLSYCLAHILNRSLKLLRLFTDARHALQMLFVGEMEKERSSNSLLSNKLISLLFDGTLKQITAMEHFTKRQMKIFIYARFRNLNKLKLIYPKRKTDMTLAGQAFLRLFVDPSRNVFLLGSTP
jgi:hypothetical protein